MRISGYGSFPDGSAVLPSINIHGTYGFFFDTNSIGVSVNGVETTRFAAAGFTQSMASGNSNFTVQGNASTQLTGQRYSNDIVGPALNVTKSRGTIAAPLPVAAGDFVGNFQFLANGTSGSLVAVIAGLIRGVVKEPTPSPTAMGMYFNFQATPLGSVTAIEVMRIDADTGLNMYGANVVIDSNRGHVLRSMTVAQLNALTAVATGTMFYCTDATTPAWNTALTGGGAVHCTAIYNGTTWVAG